MVGEGCGAEGELNTDIQGGATRRGTEGGLVWGGVKKDTPYNVG